LKTIFLKTFLLIALIAVIISLSGCQVKPADAVNSFFKAVADKDLNVAASFCTKTFSDKFTNLPSALKNYNYSMKKINWDLKNLYVKKNGMLAEVYLSIEREWPVPARLQAILAVDLINQKGKWYISSIQSTIPDYVEFTTKPQNDDKYFLFTLIRPRWVLKKSVNEPLPLFVKRYDKTCYSWLH